jgi:hypothetical protein
MTKPPQLESQRAEVIVGKTLEVILDAASSIPLSLLGCLVRRSVDERYHPLAYLVWQYRVSSLVSGTPFAFLWL